MRLPGNWNSSVSPAGGRVKIGMSLMADAIPSAARGSAFVL
jgi:hypothetical protein